MEPEPKRHAGQKSLLSMQTLQPTASTSIAVASTQQSSPSVQMVQPIVPTSSALAIAPPTLTAAPVAAPTSTQVVTPILPSQTTIPHASLTPAPAHSSDAFSRLAGSTLSFLVRSQINPGSSFGPQPGGSLQPVDMSGAGPGHSQSSQVNAPAKSIPVPEEKQFNAPAAKSSNTSSAREGSLVPQPEKALNHKPPLAINLQGPSAATSSIVHPPPQKNPLFLPSPTSSPAPGSATLAAERSSALSSSARKENKENTTRNLTNARYGSKMVFAYVQVPPLPGWAKKWKARQNQSGRADELDMFGNSEDVSVSRSPSLGDFARLRSSSASLPALKDVNVGDGEESITEGVHR
jgi:hypothetical protein